MGGPLQDLSAFHRRTGLGARRRAASGGPVAHRERAESLQYTSRDPNIERVRAYRRRHPDPPEPRTPGKVRVRSYVRHRAFRIWRPREERDSQARWIAHLASYYGISRAAARKMERDTRP